MYENASKLLLMPCVENNLNKMASIMFALPYFDVSGLFRGGLEPFWRVLLSGGWLPLKTCKEKRKAGDSLARRPALKAP